MNAFSSVLEKHTAGKGLYRGKLTTLQLNLGNLCNQSCAHCHVGASPRGEKVMSKKVIDEIIAFLRRYKIQTLDVTGGSPELNPHFEYLITEARPFVDELIVRSNLTMLFEPGKEYLPGFYRKMKVRLVCSLPCYLKSNVDRQRGDGVFEKSIKALKILNRLGFSQKEGLALDLVYNPTGATLPPDQRELERTYKQTLNDNYGITFNRLITITNVPIKNFKTYLESRGEYEKYFSLLEESFNPGVLDNLMCRTFLSVGYDGRLYDCDFNQALGLALKDAQGAFLTIDRLNPGALEGKEIIIDKHCFSCTAGSGSSCQGVLTSDVRADETFLQTQCAAGTDKKEAVKAYYGKILKSKKDLQTNACCTVDAAPAYQRSILKMIEPEVINKFYGCGSPIPPVLTGCTVLDLGCGTGTDAYVASYLVGPKGRVIGIDMTEEQLSVARKYIAAQTKRFGYSSPNVDFRQGYIEDLGSAGIKDDSVDIVISNCVINLSPDKQSVFREIFRVLKTGGELYFSDVFAGRRIPEHIKNDPVFYGECLGGALYIEDFRRILRAAGCPDYRIVSQKAIILNNPLMLEKAGTIDFYSITIRAFKLPSLEDACEDYGQVAVYRGTIPEHPQQFVLDDHHIFIAGKPMLVCGNTAAMLADTRFGQHFSVRGGRTTHYGLFNCGEASIKLKTQESIGGSCC